MEVKMRGIKQTLLVLFCLFIFICEASGQCIFQSPFSGTTWHDDTKGTLTFTTTTMTGWNFKAYDQTVNSWQCLDNTTSNYLILRSTGTFSVSTNTFYAYLCLELNSITDYSFYYYQMFSEQLNAGRERVKIDPSGTLTSSQVCDSTFSGLDTEFHLLVRSGFEANAAVTCPESLLFTGDYLYLNNDGSFDCNGTTDVMDVCTNSSEVTFDYTKCSQRIGYSENGSFYCVASLTFGGFDYAVLYNRDSTVTIAEKDPNNPTALNHDTATTRFSCFCTDGATASVSPHNCTTYQTPSAYPTLADQTTVNGYLLAFNGTKYVTCPPTSPSSPSGGSDGGLSGGAVAAIVIVIILLVVAVVVIIAIYLYLRARTNKVSEVEKPIIARNGVQPRVETIDETARGAKLIRERSKLSREGTTLSREGTLTSLKKQKSDLSEKKVVKGEKESEKKPFLGLSFLSWCPCKSDSGKSVFDVCRGGICPCMKKGSGSMLVLCPCIKDSESEMVAGEEQDKTDAKTKGRGLPLKKGHGVIGSKLATKDKKDKKGSKSKTDKAKAGKGAKEKNKNAKSNTETQTEKSTLKSKETLTKSEIIIVNTPRPGSPSKGVETMTVESAGADKGEGKSTKSIGEKTPKASKKKMVDKAEKDKTKIDSEDDTKVVKKEKSFSQEKSKLFREKTDVSAISSIRRPGTAVSLSEIDSAWHNEKENKKDVQPKPTQKKKFLDWNFLVCLQGNRTPEPQIEELKEHTSEPSKTILKKTDKSKGVKGKKGEKKGGTKGGKKSSEKDKTAGKKEIAPKSSDINTTPRDTEKGGNVKLDDNILAPKHSGETKIPEVERSKTLPLRREETTVTLQDGKIAVDVYVPDETSKLKLNDTIRPLEDKKGKDSIKGMTKAKTTLGTSRPDSEKNTGAKVKKGKSELKDKSKKSDNKKTEKSKPSGAAKKKKKK